MNKATKKMTPAEEGELAVRQEEALRQVRHDLRDGIDVTYATRTNALRKAGLSVMGWIGRTGHVSEIEVLDRRTGCREWLKV